MSTVSALLALLAACACSRAQRPMITDYRLVGGNNSYEGRLEVGTITEVGAITAMEML